MHLRKYYMAISMLLSFSSCKAQKSEWQTFVIKNKMEGYNNGKIVDYGDRWKVYQNKDIIVFTYKDTLPIIWTEIIDGEDGRKDTTDSYIEETFVYCRLDKTCFKLKTTDSLVTRTEVSVDSLRRTVASFSVIPLTADEKKLVSEELSNDTSLTVFFTPHKPDISFSDSTYLQMVPAKRYDLGFALFPLLDNNVKKAISYSMIYNPMLVEGHDIQRREFSTILYNTKAVVPPEITKLYDEFERDR